MAPMIFDNMNYYLAVGIPDRKDYIEKIMKHGGRVLCSTNKLQTERTVIHLLPEAELLSMAHARTRVSLQYILDSISAQKKLNVKDYTSLGVQKKRKKHHNAPQRRTRQSFTSHDDALMLQFVAEQTSVAKPLGINSLKFWTWAQNRQVTAHSAPSMRQRYRKHLKHLTRAQVRMLLKKHFDEDRGTSSRELKTKIGTKRAKTTVEEQKTFDTEKHLEKRIDDDRGASSRERTVTKRATTVEQRKILDAVLTNLKYKTGQSQDVCVHALYRLSGQEKLSQQFLRGAFGIEILWTDAEDQALETFTRSCRTFTELQQAYDRSVFSTQDPAPAHVGIKRRRSWAQVLQRFQFLWPDLRLSHTIRDRLLDLDKYEPEAIHR